MEPYHYPVIVCGGNRPQQSLSVVGSYPGGGIVISSPLHPAAHPTVAMPCIAGPSQGPPFPAAIFNTASVAQPSLFQQFEGYSKPNSSSQTGESFMQRGNNRGNRHIRNQNSPRKPTSFAPNNLPSRQPLPVPKNDVTADSRSSLNPNAADFVPVISPTAGPQMVQAVSDNIEPILSGAYSGHVGFSLPVPSPGYNHTPLSIPFPPGTVTLPCIMPSVPVPLQGPYPAPIAIQQPLLTPLQNLNINMSVPPPPIRQELPIPHAQQPLIAIDRSLNGQTQRLSTAPNMSSGFPRVHPNKSRGMNKPNYKNNTTTTTSQSHNLNRSQSVPCAPDGVSQAPATKEKAGSAANVAVSCPSVSPETSSNADSGVPVDMDETASSSRSDGTSSTARCSIASDDGGLASPDDITKPQTSFLNSSKVQDLVRNCKVAHGLTFGDFFDELEELGIAELPSPNAPVDKDDCHDLSISSHDNIDAVPCGSAICTNTDLPQTDNLDKVDPTKRDVLNVCTTSCDVVVPEQLWQQSPPAAETSTLVDDSTVFKVPAVPPKLRPKHADTVRHRGKPPSPSVHELLGFHDKFKLVPKPEADPAKSAKSVTAKDPSFSSRMSSDAHERAATSSALQDFQAKLVLECDVSTMPNEFATSSKSGGDTNDLPPNLAAHGPAEPQRTRRTTESNGNISTHQRGAKPYYGGRKSEEPNTQNWFPHPPRTFVNRSKQQQCQDNGSGTTKNRSASVSENYNDGTKVVASVVSGSVSNDDLKTTASVSPAPGTTTNVVHINTVQMQNTPNCPTNAYAHVKYLSQIDKAVENATAFLDKVGKQPGVCIGPQDLDLNWSDKSQMTSFIQRLFEKAWDQPELCSKYCDVLMECVYKHPVPMKEPQVRANIRSLVEKSANQVLLINASKPIPEGYLMLIAHLYANDQLHPGLDLLAKCLTHLLKSGGVNYQDVFCNVLDITEHQMAKDSKSFDHISKRFSELMADRTDCNAEAVNWCLECLRKNKLKNSHNESADTERECSSEVLPIPQDQTSEPSSKDAHGESSQTSAGSYQVSIGHQGGSRRNRKVSGSKKKQNKRGGGAGSSCDSALSPLAISNARSPPRQKLAKADSCPHDDRQSSLSGFNGLHRLQDDSSQQTNESKN